ncbi:MAG: hypothetical protein IPP69_15845 [Flavobacteriales bacterium]|nr:hypothetical protein [Flavobacteriales bacterium]
MKNQLFTPNQFYIIRADKAGVFLAKIESIEGDTIVCNSLRRLYYWEGALDVTQIAAHGVDRPQSCKFSTQLAITDKSTIFNAIEFHPASDKAIESINSVKEWNKK